MATFSARGYANRIERKTSAGGKEYVKYTLCVQQKRKDKSGQPIVEKLYVNVVDFSGKDIPNVQPDPNGGETAYVGVTGYITISGWCKDGKGGANLDLTVTEYEALEPKGGAAPRASKPSAVAPPADPFGLDE